MTSIVFLLGYSIKSCKQNCKQNSFTFCIFLHTQQFLINYKYTIKSRHSHQSDVGVLQLYCVNAKIIIINQIIEASLRNSAKHTILFQIGHCIFQYPLYFCIC